MVEVVKAVVVPLEGRALTVAAKVTRLVRRVELENRILTVVFF